MHLKSIAFLLDMSIFGMLHHLVDLYQVCLNYTPGAKNGLALAVTCFT